jgi:hypothetical protein
MPIAAIAALKRIQPSTVQSYLAEAVLYGHAYTWQSFGVSDAALAAVEEAAAAVLCDAFTSTSAAACAQPQTQLVPVPGECLGTAADLDAVAAAAAPPAAIHRASGPLATTDAHASSTAQWATGVFADEDGSSHGGAPAAACRQAAARAVDSEPITAGGQGCASSPVAHIAGQRPSTTAAPMPRALVRPAKAAIEPTEGSVPVNLAARLLAAGVTVRAFR